jgi:hypothetical protein
VRLANFPEKFLRRALVNDTVSFTYYHDHL